MAQLEEPSRFQETQLPAKAFDGSHLPWQAFRWNVLAPYRIRIVDDIPAERLPTDVIEQAEAGAEDLSRYADQVGRFRAQIPLGRGFGPSPLFPPNLLPVIDSEEPLVRCMIPKGQREAHPVRAEGQQGSIYELPLARPALASGFSVEAFSTLERSELPQTLSAAGTVVHYETGYVSPGVQVICPFLSFERIKADSEEEIEHTINRCALNGSWSIRSIQMMYNKAYQGSVIPELPTAFSCAIDNNGATLHYHWIDHAEEYYMAPLRRFNFDVDADFSYFLHLIDLIENWALRVHLPRIKAAIEKLSLLVNTPPPTPETEPPEPRSRTDPASSDAIMKALKTTFNNVPWRIDEDDRTPMPLSAMKSPLRSRISAFDFANVKITQRTAVPSFAAQRARRSNSTGTDTVTSPVPSSPLSPISVKRPPVSLNNKPSVPLIRLPASPKDRQNSPASPSPPQLHAQLLALVSEVQTLRKEVKALKNSQPSTPIGTPSSLGNTPIDVEIGEHGLTPILEETYTPLRDEEFTQSEKVAPASETPPPGKKGPTVGVTEVSPLTTPTQVSYNAESDNKESVPPTVEDLGRVLADLGKRVRTQLSHLTFWQLATSVYLTVLVSRLLVSETHRTALCDLIFP